MRARSVSWLPASPHTSGTNPQGCWRGANFFTTFPSPSLVGGSDPAHSGAERRSGATGYSGASASALHRFPRLCISPAVHAYLHSHLAAEQFDCPPDIV